MEMAERGENSMTIASWISNAGMDVVLGSVRSDSLIHEDFVKRNGHFKHGF